MQNKIGEEYEGIVSSVTQFGIFVELEDLKIWVMNILFMMKKERG